MVFEFHMDATSELKRAHSILARIKDQKYPVYIRYPGSAVFFRSTPNKLKAEIGEQLKLAKKENEETEQKEEH